MEVRLPEKGETVHWEFNNWKSFLSTNTGLYQDSGVETIEEWIDRIYEKTHFDKEFLFEALSYYKQLKSNS